MADAGLLLPVLNGVPQLSRLAGVVARAVDDADPAFRLAALAVAVTEDALRLRESLRLSNHEFDRIWRLAQAQEALAGRRAIPDLAGLRHLAHEVGVDAVAGALVLLNASAPPARLTGIRDRIVELDRTPRFLPRGRDVVALGVPAGPLVGKVIDAARKAWIGAGCPAEQSEQMALVRRFATPDA
jgi:poly(A) polymerase